MEEPYRDFFVKEAAFLQQIITVMDNGTQGKNFVELKVQNHELYQDILPQNYENSYGNPAYAQKMLGEYGKVFTFLYTELHGGIAYAFEKKAMGSYGYTGTVSGNLFRICAGGNSY